MPEIAVRGAPNRRTRLLAAAAALVLGAVAVERLSRRTPGATRSEFAGARAPMPAPVLKAEPPTLAAQTEFDQLVELFRQAEAAPATAPAAAAFGKEFRETPALEQAYREFEEDQKSPEPKGTLRAFARSLADKPEFRALVARFSGEPGFRQLALQFAARPDIREAIHEVLEKAKAERGRPRSNTVAARGPQPLPLAGPAGHVGQPGPRPSGSPRDPAVALAKIPDARAGRVDPAHPDVKPAAARTDAHYVAPHLQAIDAAGPANAAILAFCQQYRGFCEGNPPNVKPRFKNVVGLMDSYGLWGACLRLGIFHDCHQACADGACGERVDGWMACESPDFAGLSERACVAQCQLSAQRPCHVPPDLCSAEAAGCSAQDRADALASLFDECGPLKSVTSPACCVTGTCGPAAGSSGATGPSLLGYRHDGRGGYTPIAEEKQFINQLFARLYLNGEPFEKVYRKMKDATVRGITYVEHEYWLSALAARQALYCGVSGDRYPRVLDARFNAFCQGVARKKLGSRQ